MKRKGYGKKPCDGLEEFVSSIESSQLVLLGTGNPEDRRKRGEIAALARAFVLRFEEFYFRDVSIDRDSETELRSMLEKIKKYAWEVSGQSDE